MRTTQMSLVPWSSGYRGEIGGACEYTHMAMDQVDHEFSYLSSKTVVCIEPSNMHVLEYHGWIGKRYLVPKDDLRVKYHEIVLGALSRYRRMYVAVKQVMRKLPSELEKRVYEFM